MFFDGWDSVARVTLLTAATYILLIAMLRVIGEQALAKMSAYDMIVTIALGSLLVSIPLGSGVTLADGFAAIVTVLVLQEGTRFLVKRSRRTRQVIRQQPHLVLWDGHLLHQRMEEVNIIEEE